VPLTAYAHSQLLIPPTNPAPAPDSSQTTHAVDVTTTGNHQLTSTFWWHLCPSSHLTFHLMDELEIMVGQTCEGGAPVKNQLKPFFTEIRPSDPASIQGSEQVSKKVKIHY